MESFLGNAKSYYQSIPSTGRTYEGAPLPTTSGTVVTVASTNFQYGIAAPLQAPVTTRALPAAVAPPKPYSSNVITPSHHSLYSPSHTSGQVIPQYSSEGLPYPPQSSRLFSNSPSQQSSHSSISPYASGSHNPVQHSYAPTHSRPPDFTRGKVDQRNPSISRSLEVTRVGPAHTFSSISPENSQTIMSRPNAAHSLISGSHKSEYRLPPENPYLMQRQNYMSNSQRSIASQHAVSSRNPGAPHSSSKGATHNPPTLIKAEEPTTLSAAHFQPHQSHSKPGSSGGSSSNSSSCNNNKRFETATAPVPYALAKRSEDSFFAEKLEESYACIKRVENPYAIGKTTSESVASTLSVTGEVEIRRQRNEAYFLKTYHPSDYSQMNGTRESHHHNSPESAIPKDFNKKLVSPDEAKSDIVLDLSVKTVRQTADSTAPEPDYATGIPPAHNNYQSGNNLTISSRSPTPSSNTQNEKLCSPQIGNAYGYIKPPIMTPPQFAQLTAQDNGIPSSSSRHPTLKRPGDSTPSWEHLSKAPKMDPSIAMRAKSPYPAASITHHTKEAFKSSVHSSCIDSSRDAEIYNTVVKNEPVYPGFTDRASPYDTRMYNDPYKQWSSLYKSKSQTFTSKGERIYNPPLGHDVKSETLASQMVKKSQDSRYPYPQLNESNPNPIVNPNLYYNMDYLSNPSYNLATTTKGKLSTGDYYNHYLTSTQEDRLKDSTATPISDERISKSGSGTAEISKEIRVKTESEINSCIPICTPSSMHYSSDNRPSYHSPLNSNPVTKPHTNNLDLVESLNKASESISENFKKAIDFTQFDKRLSECSAQPNSVDSKTHEKSTTSETGKLITSEVQNISHDCTSPIKLKESANLISETCSEFKKERAETSKETVNEAIRSIGSSSNENESDHCKEDIRKDTIINKDEFSMENDKISSGATSENIKENENSKQEEFVTDLENKDLSNSIDKPPTVKDDPTNKSVSEHEALEEGEKDSEASHKVHKSSEMKLEIAGNKVEQKQDEDKKLPLESSPKVINNDEKTTKEEIEGPSNSEQKAVNKQSSLNDCETDGNAEKELKENENDVEKSNTKLTSTLKLDKDEQGNQIKLSTSETSEKISEIPESKETKVSSPSKLKDVSPENKETEEERSDVPVPNKKQIEKTILPLSDKKNDQMIQDNINNTKTTPNAASNCIEMEGKEKLHQENNKIMEKDEEDSVSQSKSEELSVDSKTENSLISSCENQIDLSNLSNKHNSSKRSPSPPMEEKVAAKLLDRHDKVKDISTEDKDKNCSKEREENNYCAAKLKGNSSCSPNIFKEHLMQMAEKKPSPETSSTESKNGEPEQYSSKSENEQLAEKGNVGNDKSLKMVPYVDKVNVTEAQVSGPRDPSNSHLNVTENLTVATKTTDKELKSKIVKNEDKILDFSNSRNAKSEFQEEESKSYDQISHSTSYNYNLSVEHSIQKKLNPNYIQSASSSSTTVQNLEPKSEDKNVLNLHKPQSIQDSFLASKSFASRPHSLPSTSSHSIPPPSHSAPPDASTPKKICSQAKSPVPLKTIPKQEPEQPQSDRLLETPRTLLSPHSPRHPPPPPPPSETSLHDRSSSFFPQSVPSAPLNHPSVSLQSSYPITTTIPISTYSAHLIQKKHVSDNTPFGIHNDPMLHAKSSGKFSHSKQDDHTHKPFPSFATSVSQPSSYNYPPGYASGFYGKYSQGQSDPEMNYPQISISQFTAPESKKDTSYHRSISEYTSSVSSSNTTSVTSYESCYPNSSYSYYPSHSSSSSKTPTIQNIPVCHPSPFYSSSYPSVAGMYPPNHPNYLSLQQTPESAHCMKSSDSKSPSCTVSKATCHKNSNSYDDLKRFSSPPYSSNFSSMQGSSQNSYYSITKTTLESPRSSRSATPHSSISPSMSRNASPHHSKHSSPSLTKEPMNKQDSYMGESFTPINLSSESNNKSLSSSPLDSLKSSSQFVVLNKPTLTNQPPASHQYQSVSSASTNNYFYKPSPTVASGTPNKPYGSFPHYAAKPSESLSVGAKSPIPKTYASKSPTPGISYNSKSPVQSNLYHGMTHAHSLHSSKSGNALYRGKSPLPFSHPSEQLHSSPGNYQQLYQNPYYQDYQQRFYNNTDSSNLGSYSDFKKMKQDSQPSNYQTQKESSNNEMRSQPSFSMSGVSTNTTTITNYQNYASSYSNNYATPQNYIPQPTSSCQSPTVHSSQGLSSQQAYSKNFSGLGSNKFTYPTTTDHTSQIPPNYPPVSQSQRLSQKTQKSHLPVTTSSHQYPVSSQIPFSSHISNSSQSSMTHSTISNHQQKGASARPSSDPYPHPHPAHHYPTQISNHAHQSNFPGSIPAVSNHSQTSDPHCQVLESVSHHSSAPSSSYLYPNVSQQTFTSAQLPYSSSKQSYSPSHLSYKNSSSLSHSVPSGSNQYTPNYKSLPITPRTFQNDQTSSPPNSHQSSQAPLNHKLPPPPPSHQSRPPSTHQPLPPPSHHLPPPPSHHLPPPPSHQPPPPPSHQPPPPPSHQTPPKSHQPPPLRSHHLPPPPSHHPPPPPSHQLPPPPSHQPPPPPSHHGHPLPSHQPPPPPSHHPPPPPSHHSSSRISSQHHFQSPSSTQSPQHQINNHSSSPSHEVKPLSFNQHASVGHHLHPSHHSYTHTQRTVDQNARSAPRPTNPLPSNHYPPSSAYSMYKHHSFKQNESGNSSAQTDNAVGHSQKSHRISSRNESPVHYKPFPTQPPQAHLSQPVPDSQNISVNSPYISAHSYHQPNNAQPNYKPSNSESLDGQNLRQNSNAKSPLSNYLAHHQSLPQGSYPQRPPVQYHSSPYPSQSTSQSTHSPYYPPSSSKANNSYSSHSKPPPLPSDVTTKSDKEVTSHDSAKQPASESCTLNSKESSRQEASCVLKSKLSEEDRPPVAIPEEKYSSENDGQSKASEETQETGKAVLVEKLQKKLVKKDSDEKVNEDNKGSMKPVEVKVLTEEDELNEKFDKLMDDLSFHKDSITSKKSCILGRRYIQKVQLQYAVDNNEVIVPETYIEEEESESEREEPVKKFRGKFRSIKDKAVERVILTYASHSDESATEMIPDDDASDFEEELIKEIEAKARKNKGKGKNVKSRDSSFETKKGDTQSKRKNLSKSKRDNEYTMSSSYNDSSSRGSSSSDDDSNSDDSSSTSGSSSSGFSIASKRRNMRRRKRRPQSSSNSDEDFLPQRKTRRSKKLSSEDETFKPPSHKSRRKGKRPMSRKVKRKADLSDEESPQRNKSYKRGARVVVDDDENSDSESAANDGSKQKRKRESLKLKILKNRTNISSSESEDDTKSSQTKRKSASDSDEIFTPSQSSSKKLMKIIDSESDSDKKLSLEPQKLDDEKTNDILENEKHLSQVIFLNNEELLQNNKDDSVLLKLSKIRDEELNRDDVLEMKNWTETASTEMKKLLEDLLETKWRHSWKKPTFYREDFKKGWQAEVKKYKMDVARIPKSLISTPPPPPQVINEADSSNSVSSAKKTKESSKKSKGKGSPAKNTRSKSGIVKTSLTLNENDRLKVAARPEISNVMERFFEKVLGDPVHLDSSKKLPAFGPFTPISRSPTGLTPTPSLALSMIASDDSDRDSLASLRTDLPASDSVPVAPRRRSIANSLIKKLRKKYKDKKIDSQLFNKSRSIMEPTNKPSLLPTPGLSVSTDDSKSPAKYDQLRLTTFFRKDSVSRYRETFDDAALKNGINEFTPILVPSRTRKKTKAILDAATIRAVFGADPSEIPSVSPKEKLIKEEQPKLKTNTLKKVILHQDNKRKEPTPSFAPSPIPSSVSHSSTPIDFLFNDDDDSEVRNEELVIIQGIRKSRKKIRKLRKRSGFDYIRKKKKAKPEEEIIQASKRKVPVRKRMIWPEENKDIANEIRNWVINKGLGETVLHKAARLQYHDVVIYCLESSDYNVNAKDNAGYTPLHEACNRGHLDIAQALCAHHAHVNASGFGGMRPLHEAIENGHIELARLLLAYGADPSLSTYGGQTCLALATDPQTERFINEFMCDLKGKRTQPWHIMGPSKIFDLTEQGSDVFADVPGFESDNSSAITAFSVKVKSEESNLEPKTAEPELDGKDISFESSEQLLPAVFSVKGRDGQYVLLRELLDHLSMTRKELIIAAGSIETLHLGSEDCDKKLRCLIIGYKVTLRPETRGHVTLVKYTSAVRRLLDVEVTQLS